MELRVNALPDTGQTSRPQSALKQKFFADPTIDLCYLTPAGYLTIWFQLA